MKKAKVISEAGQPKFEAALNKWFSENSSVKIISVSFSNNHVEFPDPKGKLLVNEVSALIIYEEPFKPGGMKKIM